MNKLVFKELFVFSSNEKKAKMIRFSDGKNIITTSSADGTDRGKSVIMRSLYHTMGADCYFDDKWNNNDKIYIVKFEINNKEFYMYRFKNLFKCFNNNFELIFKDIKRQEVSKFLYSLFDFAVRLPKRNEETLEITPPVYNYILYFLDQDKQSGPNFTSFNNLGQYDNFKENVLLYHFGVFNEEYYNIIKNIEQIRERKINVDNRKEVIQNMLEKISPVLDNIVYSKNLDLLREQVNNTKEDYLKITKELSLLKGKLIELRNDKQEIEDNLSKLKIIGKTNENEISELSQHTCPICNSNIEDTTILRLERYNKSDDIILLSNDLQISFSKTEIEIQKREDEYNYWLDKLNLYEEKLNIKSDEIKDVLKHKGYIEINENLTEELRQLKDEYNIILEKEKEYNQLKKTYGKSKSDINRRYYELMILDKIKFGLQEIDDKKFENITKNFMGSGSNRPISTIIWYINLIKIKNEFNPNAIKFPIVFDSPNNAETDDDKRSQVYKYLVDNVENNQLIVSAIGYDSINSSDVSFDNVIFLGNEKYNLLCEDDYNKYNKILLKFSDS